MEKSLEQEVLETIIDSLSLEDVDVENFDYDAPIFASYDPEEIGLGLDSVDALELFVGLKSKFGIKIMDSDIKIFQSVRTIADFIKKQRAEA